MNTLSKKNKGIALILQIKQSSYHYPIKQVEFKSFANENWIFCSFYKATPGT